MSRALRVLLAWGFAPVAEGGRGLETVVWLANRGNWASRRLAWSVGFSFDGDAARLAEPPRRDGRRLGGDAAPR